MGIGHHHDVLTEGQFVLFPCFDLLGAPILNHAIAILVFPSHLLGLFELSKPRGKFLLILAVQTLDEVNPSKRTNRWSGEINDRDKRQRPTSRSPHCLDIFHGEKSHDDVRKPCCPAHQGSRDTKHVDRRKRPAGIVTES